MRNRETHYVDVREERRESLSGVLGVVRVHEVKGLEADEAIMLISFCLTIPTRHGPTSTGHSDQW